MLSYGWTVCARICGHRKKQESDKSGQHKPLLPEKDIVLGVDNDTDEEFSVQFRDKWKEAEEAHKLKKDSDEGLIEQKAFEWENSLDDVRKECLRLVHDAKPGPRISLAFSGGGQRAAAFAGGLLWALAEHDLLPNVKHISAVSGGGYTASAFGAHLQEQSEKDPPKKGEALKDWYFKVVQNCLLQMQDNISHLTGSPKKGLFKMTCSSLGFFFGSLFFMVVNAFTFTMYAVVPFAAFLVHHMGPDMRSDFCNPVLGEVLDLDYQESQTVQAYLHGFEIQTLPFVLLFAFILTATTILPDEKKRFSCRNSAYFVVHWMRLICTRWLKLMSWYTLTLLLVTFGQHARFGGAGASGKDGANVMRLCMNYIMQSNTSVGSSRFRCTDQYLDRRFWREHESEVWYNIAPFNVTYGNETWRSENNLTWGNGNNLQMAESPYDFSFGGPIFNLTTHAGVAWCACALFAFLFALAWFFRLNLMSDIAKFAAPLLNLLLLSEMVRWKIYGPITKQRLFLLSSLEYSDTISNVLFFVMFATVTLTLPVVGHMLEFGHNINSIRLGHALYPKGKEKINLADVHHVYGPNLIFGSCVQDWGRPTDKVPYADFELTPLQIGGRRTHYWATGDTRIKLFTAVGCSGAAADIVMSTEQSEKARWLVGMLSVRMGAWVRVRSWTHGCWLVSRGEHDGNSRRCCKSPEGQEFCEEQLLRLGGMVTFFVWYILVWVLAYEYPLFKTGSWQCDYSSSLCECNSNLIFYIVFAGFVAFFVLMHTSHVPLRPVRKAVDVAKRRLTKTTSNESGSALRASTSTSSARSAASTVSEEEGGRCHGLCRCSCRLGNCVAFNILRSPLIRNLLMMCNHFHKSWSVPEYLYLVDGGVMDSLGVVALLRRRERWIISTDAAGPLKDPCRFVRECMQTAIKLKLCSFADPKGTNRHWGYLLEDYEKNASQAVLHLQIFYEAHADSLDAPKRGDIFFISQRCDKDKEDEPQKGLLTSPLEHCAAEPGSCEAGRKRRELYGALCCDSCHDNRCFNGCAKAFCGKFPSPTMANQFLTSRMFAELCHLGHELGSEAIKKMTGEGAWKDEA